MIAGKRIFYSVLVVASIAAAAYSLFATSATVAQKKLILVFWLVFPPTYFFFEYYFRQPKVDAAELARLKDMQDRAAKIWAGVSAALAAIYFKS
jgi:hypothetical protein